MVRWSKARLTLRNLPTWSRMSLNTNPFFSPLNQPSLVIRAINWGGVRVELKHSHHIHVYFTTYLYQCLCDKWSEVQLPSKILQDIAPWRKTAEAAVSLPANTLPNSLSWSLSCTVRLVALLVTSLVRVEAARRRA